MDAIGNALIKGYDKYYNILTQVGHINRKSVNQMLVATWIYNVLSGKYGVLVNEDQYNVLNGLYNCIEGSCLVPYQNYCKEFTINKNMRSDYVRITEDSDNRLLEDIGGLRMI